MGDWTFFSNYGHVLVCLARNRRARLRDVAQEVGITERAVQKIVRDLQEGGYLTVTKQGRCNRYQINRRKSLRHGLVSQCTVGKLLAVVMRAEPAGAAEPAPPDSKPAVESPPLAERTRTAVTADEPPSEPPPEPAKSPKEKRAGKSRKRDAPVDTRQQGSLF